MVTWHDTIFLQSIMQHRASEWRDYSWFIIFLFLTYSHTFLLGLGGPCWQRGALWFALSVGQGEPHLLQVACSSHVLSRGEHAPSRASKKLTAHQPGPDCHSSPPGYQAAPQALCLPGFIHTFNVVFIPELTGWSNRWVELESLVFQPGSVCWGCWRAARH